MLARLFARSMQNEPKLLELNASWFGHLNSLVFKAAANYQVIYISESTINDKKNNG